MARYINPDDLERFEALETRQTIRKSRPSYKDEQHSSRRDSKQSRRDRFYDSYPEYAF